MSMPKQPICPIRGEQSQQRIRFLEPTSEMNAQITALSVQNPAKQWRIVREGQHGPTFEVQPQPPILL